ncbi:MAG: hypothetical protein GXO91_04400 [FCB group bacterium]|nr:hypothetical protein [FCB group bacterium]
MRIILPFIGLLLILACTNEKLFLPPNPYDDDAAVLRARARISVEDISESSAIEKSNQYDDVYWTLNDSGDEARIFAIDGDGNAVKPRWAEDYHGIILGNAVNVDWEDLAVDNTGTMYIAAFGNNGNVRRDLAVYVLPEPDPRGTITTRIQSTLNFRYPDQDGFPPKKKNFDAEALFSLRGKLYLLTKHRSDTFTKLYRFDETSPLQLNTLTLVDRYDVGGMVTAADAADDGSMVAILTYNSIWVVETPPDSDLLFSGQKFRYPIMAKQCEGICFDGENLRLTNEQRDIFIVPLSKVKKHPVK